MQDHTPLSGARGQTSIDFVVGMGVFLLTVAFVVSFLPNVFAPFDGTESGDVLAAERFADLLAEQWLADAEAPASLNATCTAEFFTTTDDGNIDRCPFDTDAADLDGALGTGPTTSANVTIEENGTIRSIGAAELRAGSEPSQSQSVTVARRVVLLGGEERDLYVRVW